jgi:hypothetical protein
MLVANMNLARLHTSTYWLQQKHEIETLISIVFVYVTSQSGLVMTDS